MNGFMLWVGAGIPLLSCHISLCLKQTQVRGLHLPLQEFCESLSPHQHLQETGSFPISVQHPLGDTTTPKKTPIG